jgi:succinate-acetate transporter protein
MQTKINASTKEVVLAMSTIDYSSRTAPSRQRDTNGHGELHREWGARTRIFLTPVAAPSILGLFGFAASTFIVAAFLAGWYGGSRPAAAVLSNVAPFCLFFGGLAQFMAAMWAYRARDAVATAMHGTWGAFWMAFGVFFTLLGAHVLHLATGGPGVMVPYSYWFYTLAVITGCGFFAALFRNAGLSAVLLALALGSACVAIGFDSGVTTWTHVGGYVLVVSAGLAVYTATALMLLEAFGKVILPLGQFPYSKREHWAPGAVLAHPMEYAEGMPGSKIGQ